MLRTPRLLLRPVRLDDLDDWWRLDHEPGVLRFIRPDAPTREDKAESIRRAMAVARLHHGHGFYSAFSASDDFVGWFHLRPSGEGDVFNPELGYRLRPEFWGQGLAGEGSRALLELAFDELSAFRVVARTMVVNQPSRRVLEGLGMRLESLLDWERPWHVEGDEQGEARYRITVTDWLEQPNPREQLRDLQQATLVAHRGGSAEATERLDTLRAIGMQLAGIETEGVRASRELVRRLASGRGVELV